MKNQRHEITTGKNAKNFNESSACVVEIRLTTSPIEEFEAGEYVIVVAAMTEDTDDEGFGERK
jgi:hypothetical protein